MKKLILLIISLATIAVSLAQETLQSVTDRGSTTTQFIRLDGLQGNALIFSVGSINKGLITNSYNIFGSGETNDLNLYTYEEKPVSIYTNALQRFTVTGNGNIGIGTTSPNTRLEINGDELRMRNGTGWGKINIYRNGIGNWQLWGDNSTNRMHIGLNDMKSVTFDTNGSVGIGTSLPGAKLDVADISPILRAKSTTAQGSWIGLQPLGDGTNDVAIVSNWATGASNLYFKLGQTEGVQMTITNGGNVGIGTTTPDTRLAVNGTIHTKEVKVDMNGWPDYVFSENHKPLPLPELEQYIKENKHLPEIPSEAEVKDEGVALGEMNAKLLKKIEELTLYLIEQNKKLLIQDQSNTELKKEIEQLKLK